MSKQSRKPNRGLSIRSDYYDVDIDHEMIIMEPRQDNEKYTNRYRLAKTLLLILTFISFGLNFELIGPTLEDLRVYMNVNYSQISFSLVMRSIGYLGLTALFGLILDKFTNYFDILMSISSLIVAIS
jgi:fucose permease